MPNCKGTHEITQCPELKAADPRRKRGIVAALQLCNNCLQGGHIAGACPKPPACPQCGERHHDVMHQALERRKPTTKRTGVSALALAAAEESSEDEEAFQGCFGEMLGDGTEQLCGQGDESVTVPGAAAFPAQEVDESVIGDALPISSEVVAKHKKRRQWYSLRFVVVRLVNPDTQKEVLLNAILDEGANLTAVRRDVLDKLGVQGRNIDVRI